MAAPLAKAILDAISRAAVSNAAKKRLMQAAAKKVTQKDIKSLIRTEMQTGAPQLGRASRRPDVANPPKRVVERRGSTGSVRPPKVDPAKEIYNLYRKKPDTRTVTRSAQKERVTPADVVAQRGASKAARTNTTRPSGKPVAPARTARPGEARAALKREARVMRDKRKREIAAQKRLIAKSQKAKEAIIRKKAIRDAAEDPRNTLVPRQPTIESRTPRINPERPPKSETAAFGELSKSERQAYREIERRLAEGLKKIRDAERGKTPRKNIRKSSPTRGKKTK
jgi:hypothetical protein